MQRIIAVIMLFIPGVIAAFGIKLMRDALFVEYYPVFFNTEIQFTAGLIMLALGTGFLGGFIYHRDKKRKLVKPRKSKKKTS